MFVIISAILGLTGVIMGAMGDHAIKGKTSPELYHNFVVGLRYHQYHSLVLLIIGLFIVLAPHSLNHKLDIAGYGFLLGVILFSGSLYLYTFTGEKAFAYLTPVGGITLMLSWAAVIYSGVLMVK